MVRIIKEDLPETFSAKATTVLNLLGVVIAKDPAAIKRLLTRFNVELSVSPTPAELSGKVLLAIEQLGKPFHDALARVIMSHVEDKSYDSFGPAIPAITGALGSVADLFKGKQQRKLMQEQARSQTMSAMLAYKAQQERAAMAEGARHQQHTNQMAMVKTIGTLAVVVLIGLLLFFSLKKPASPTHSVITTG